jgi:hypothetical protein
MISHSALPLWQKEDGMIVIHQTVHDEFGDRFPIPKDKILVMYTAATTEIEDFPRLPQHGFGTKTKYGDWFIYNDLDKCKVFVEHHPVLVMEHFHDNETIQIQFTTKVVDLTDRGLKSGQLSQMALNNFTVHVAVHVPMGILFRRVMSVSVTRK